MRYQAAELQKAKLWKLVEFVPHVWLDWLDQRWGNSVLMTEYEYYSVWKNRPNTQTVLYFLKSWWFKNINYDHHIIISSYHHIIISSYHHIIISIWRSVPSSYGRHILNSSHHTSPLYCSNMTLRRHHNVISPSIEINPPCHQHYLAPNMDSFSHCQSSNTEFLLQWLNTDLKESPLEYCALCN